MHLTVATSILVSMFAVAAADDNARPPAIEPEAITALQKMGTFLREQQSFTVHTTTETDYVLDNGQKVRLSSRGELLVRRPDHMRADVVSDRKERQFFYDGKTFTMYGPRVGYYATVAAPNTINGLATTLEDEYGLEFPLVDLFRLGSDPATIRAITSATVIGPEKLDGVVTDHYAFRQPGLDWQIWIERGPRPVPRKLVLTTTDVSARPEHSVAMNWELGARHPDSVFAFVPPKDSSRIAMAPLLEARAQQARRAPHSVRN